IGANGSGKTSLLNVLSGFSQLDAGKFAIGGVWAGGFSPHRVGRRGPGPPLPAAPRVSSPSTLGDPPVGPASPPPPRPRLPRGRAAPALRLPRAPRGRSRSARPAPTARTPACHPAGCGDPAARRTRGGPFGARALRVREPPQAASRPARQNRRAGRA